MYIYYFPVAITCFSAFVAWSGSRRADVLLLSFIVVGVALIAGLRLNADVDYEPYWLLYKEIPALSKLGVDNLKSIYGEPGYLFFTSVIKSTGAPFFLVTLIASAISISIKSYIAFKFVRNASFAVATYLCFSFITIEFIQIRWAVATSLIALAFYFLYQNHRKRAIICFILAASFHYFSIVFFLLSAFLSAKRFQVHCAVLLGAFLFSILSRLGDFSFVIALDNDLYIVSRFLRYINDPLSTVGVFSYLKILLYVAIVAVLYRTNSCQISYGDDRAFRYLFNSSAICVSAALFSSFIPIFFHRAIVLGDFFSILLISYMISRMRHFDARVFLVTVVALVVSLWSVMDVSNYAKSQSISTYKSWLDFVY